MSALGVDFLLILFSRVTPNYLLEAGYFIKFSLFYVCTRDFEIKLIINNKTTQKWESFYFSLSVRYLSAHKQQKHKM